MEDANRAELQERLAILEQTVAYQHRLGLVGFLAFFAMISLTLLTTRPSKNLVVESLELRDPKGTVRTRLALNSDETPMLNMYDHKGIRLLGLGQTFAGSSSVTFYDQGELRAQLGSIGKGAASLRFVDDANETMSSVFMRPDRGMGLSLATGEKGFFVGLEPNGKPSARLVDVEAVKEGRSRLTLEDIERFSKTPDLQANGGDDPSALRPAASQVPRVLNRKPVGSPDRVPSVPIDMSKATTLQKPRFADAPLPRQPGI